MYIDQKKKIEYYRKLIMDTIAKTGSYPAPSLVQDRLNDIDASLSIYRMNYKSSGDTFDTDEYNNSLNNIYQDLLILYQSVYELSVKDYNELKTEIDRELQDLETMAQKCYRRSELETTNTFGKTLFFQASGFKQEYESGIITIPIDTITTHEQATLACIVDGADTLPYDSMYFEINDKRVKPYNYNSDTYKVPGNDNVNTYAYTITDEKKSSTFPFTIDKFMPIEKATYKILSGKNSVVFYDTQKYNSTSLTKESNMSLRIAKNGIVTFYVYNAKNISFEFNKEPTSKNFKENTITTPDMIQKIRLVVETGTVFNVITDGTIYAYYDAGFISDNILYGYRHDTILDYLLIETKESDTVTISGINLVIENAEHSYYGITDIAIKESEVVIV